MHPTATKWNMRKNKNSDKHVYDIDTHLWLWSRWPSTAVLPWMSTVDRCRQPCRPILAPSPPRRRSYCNSRTRRRPRLSSSPCRTRSLRSSRSTVSGHATVVSPPCLIWDPPRDRPRVYWRWTHPWLYTRPWESTTRRWRRGRRWNACSTTRISRDDFRSHLLASATGLSCELVTPELARPVEVSHEEIVPPVVASSNSERPRCPPESSSC